VTAFHRSFSGKSAGCVAARFEKEDDSYRLLALVPTQTVVVDDCCIMFFLCRCDVALLLSDEGECTIDAKQRRDTPVLHRCATWMDQDGQFPNFIHRDLLRVSVHDVDE
jgi:hypothetical protein